MINPIANADQFAAEDDVISLWKDERILDARRLVGQMWKSGWGDTPPDEVRPLIESHIDSFVTNWLFKAVASDGQHPRLVRNFMPPHHWHGRDIPGAQIGGDNPDNCYRLAGIDHGTRYRLIGRTIGKAPANTSFTLVGNYGTSVTIQTIENQQLAFAEDGSFQITIDDTPADGRLNHLTTVSNVKFLFIRDSMENWQEETPYELTIERIGDPLRPPLTTNEMAVRAAFRMCEDVPLYHWFQSIWTSLQPNRYTVPAMLRGLGGLVTQGISMGYFQLTEDDAVIIDYDPAGADYASIQISDWLYRSLDADRAQSSLTRTQSVTDSDGRIRVVIARSDPGVANWLDCRNFQHVLVLHRWQALPAEPLGDGPTAAMQMTKINVLRQKLPEETRWVSAQQRQSQIDQRNAAYARRLSE